MRVGALRWRVGALLLAGVLCTNLSALSLWSWRVFASSQGFADAVTDMLKEPAVRQVVASQNVTALEQQAATEQASVNIRPLLEQVVTQVVATDAFQGIFHAGVRELHAGVMQGRPEEPAGGARYAGASARNARTSRRTSSATTAAVIASPLMSSRW